MIEASKIFITENVNQFFIINQLMLSRACFEITSDQLLFITNIFTFFLFFCFFFTHTQTNDHKIPLFLEVFCGFLWFFVVFCGFLFVFCLFLFFFCVFCLKYLSDTTHIFSFNFACYN